MRHRCGRPTQTGTRCGRILEWHQVACADHATAPEYWWSVDRLLAAVGRDRI